MTDDILDIANWKNDYPFLKNVSEVYDKFNSNEYVGESRRKYDLICYSIINGVKGRIIREHIDICMKLMRNLENLSEGKHIYAPTFERCNILYNWIYNSMKENKVPENVIEECFNENNEYMRNTRKYTICSKQTYEEKFEEPIKMTILQIFENNMQIIINTLNGQTDSNIIPWRKFVCECFNIYKYMNENYCLNKTPQNSKQTSTCETLKKFKIAYENFRNNIGSLNTFIPSVENIEGEYIAKCSPEKTNQELTFGEYQKQNPPLEVSVSKNDVVQDRILEDALSSTFDIADNSIKKNITTTIGTVAAASSLLALLYKFTPARRLINPQLRRATGIINNNFYGDDANGILFNGNEHNEFNSYSIGYEAA